MRINVPCKINLFLDVTGRRADGYHLLATAFHTVGIYDILTIAEADTTTLTVTGPYAGLSGDPEKNTVMKIYRHFEKEFGFNRNVAITLEKHIPVGAGLGGGSADAAYCIKALNEIGGFGLSADAMRDIGVIYGADVPFFIDGGFAWAEGIGDVLLPKPRMNADIIVIYPNIHVSTKDAYAAIRPDDYGRGDAAAMRAAIDSKRVDKVAGLCYNIFEGALFRNMEALAAVKKDIERHAGMTAHMSGSGSAFFIIFEDGMKASLVYHALAENMKDSHVFPAKFV
ncbi:MAG: 4-(cytidine 5'-diphospho)-2-C-methyl-D-erythritol kinase [Spirochaetes bacterium]|nr:4-(cytidine 5'-diphospho)-2-C-methyl-D-erythritol kinase [Spirochaetota bacterium]